MLSTARPQKVRDKARGAQCERWPSPALCRVVRYAGVAGYGRDCASAAGDLAAHRREAFAAILDWTTLPTILASRRRDVVRIA